jgi:hypothetical protein
MGLLFHFLLLFNPPLSIFPHTFLFSLLFFSLFLLLFGCGFGEGYDGELDLLGIAGHESAHHPAGVLQQRGGRTGPVVDREGFAAVCKSSMKNATEYLATIWQIKVQYTV